MCGIIGFISKTKKSNIQENIINQYQEQHHRGSEGFGLIEIKKNKITVKRATEPVKALLDIRFSTAPMAIFHHRQPTSTDNTIKQTHPIKVTHPELKHDYLITHNGVISNSKDLFKKHTEELGYVYQTHNPTKSTSNYWWQKFNDSEAFAIELARYLENIEKEIGTEGSVAFIALQINKKTQKPQNMFWGRNDRNPIELLETKEGILIASSINDINAELIAENSYDSINIKKLFEQNLKNPRDLIKTKTLKFKKIPEIIITPYNNRTAGYDLDTTKKEPEDEFDIDNFEERTEGYTTRMKAYMKMSDRIVRNHWQDIEDLCQEMAFAPISDEQITEVVSKIKDTLIEKEKLSEKRIRPYFDRKEEQEIQETPLDQNLNTELDAELKAEIENNTESLQKNFYF